MGSELVVGIRAAGTAVSGVSAAGVSAIGAVCVCSARVVPGISPNSRHITSAKANRLLRV